MAISNWTELKRTISKINTPKAISRSSSKFNEIYQTSPYYECDLEYQQREGYCASTTMRNELKSIPQLENSKLPVPISKPSTPPTFAKTIDLESKSTISTIVYGSDGLDKFVQAIKLVNSPNHRVAINFLGSALYGWKSRFNPALLLFSIMGGHFSNIIGYDDKTGLVALFDVNHRNGIAMVRVEELFEAVDTYDFSTQKTRALIVTKLNKI